ncbi:hypothetical protein C0995_014246, partial [Termitomyces sp. Mi166
MSNNLGKRLHSPEQQGSVKRPNQDHDSQAVFQLEQAKQLLRRIRDDKMHEQLSSLLQSKASLQELQACYSPFFKELARIVIGRDDIPVPSTLDDAKFMYRLWSPHSSADELADQWDLERLIDN